MTGISYIYRVAPLPPPPQMEQSIQSIFQDFALINSHLVHLDKASFPHYNNTTIIKFG